MPSDVFAIMNLSVERLLDECRYNWIQASGAIGFFNTILKIVATNSWMDMAISRFASIALILVV